MESRKRNRSQLDSSKQNNSGITPESAIKPWSDINCIAQIENDSNEFVEENNVISKRPRTGLEELEVTGMLTMSRKRRVIDLRWWNINL